ncbi:MAG: glycosyltransferase family 4 protein [Spirochaetes bacterium]|nr:glycosyltransferase family 4 protein [Spirochaetota bacterium]
MRIAVEAHALSDDKLTGVGKVILHYLNELQMLDRENEYFIYTMDDLKHVTVTGPRWRHIQFNYLLKRLRLKVTSTWLRLKSENEKKKSILCVTGIICCRVIKIFVSLLDDFVYSFKVVSSLRDNQVDIYLGTSTYFYPYFFLSPVKKAGILYDLVWKLYPGTMEFGNKIRMKLFTLRNMKKMDLLVSISENTKKDARELLGITTRIDAIPLAADPVIYYPASQQSITAIRKKHGITKKFILSVCTLEPRKNLKALLQAYRTMPSRRDYQLVLVGMTGWVIADLFKDIASSDIRDNILVTGYVANEELAPLYTGAELFLFPSLYEGFGLPVLEAMQCGCPVITSNSSSIPEVAGDAAILIDPEDVETLSATMEQVLNNQTLRKNLSRMGLKRSKLFSWEKAARTLLKSLESL